LTSARTITARANPPRSVFLDLPLGHTSGPPNDRAVQTRIVREALERGAAITEPGTIIDLDYRWHHDRWKRAPLSWSRSRDLGDVPADSGTNDTRTARIAEPQYQTQADREAAAAVRWSDQCDTCLGLPGP
jgi:hypothetical protein